MKIATNTPFSFPIKDGFAVCRLGEGTLDVSAIVLMLPRNWGSSGIENIKAITSAVSSYPKSVPCYIVGCEVTIPSTDIHRYLNKEREQAIKALCDEVLERSKSIGVRGEITYRYLTEILGYSPERIDIIYTSDGTGTIERLRRFLKKNEFELKDYLSSMAAFQKAPSKVSFEKELNFSTDIIIRQPYLSEESTGVRLNSDIEINGKVITIWCETDHEYREFLLCERSDAFLSVILPLAMRAGCDIVCEAPVTEQLLHNLNEILVPQLCSYDPRLHRSQIHADPDRSSLDAGTAVATGMSCGVDSLYTASLYAESCYKGMNLTHLYVGNYLYGNSGEIYNRAKLVADEMSLPLVRTSTNINQALKLPHLPTHFFKTMFGVLSLRKLFKVYYYATTEDFGHFNLRGNGTADTSHIELLLLYTFTCSDLQILTGGVKSERAEKTRALASFAPAAKFLNVCLNPFGERNCGKCGKCRRTLLTLDVFGLLDHFADVFPVQEYRDTRFESLVYLFSHKRSSYLADVFDCLQKQEPVIMKKAEEEFLRRAAEKRIIKLSPSCAGVG